MVGMSNEKVKKETDLTVNFTNWKNKYELPLVVRLSFNKKCILLSPFLGERLRQRPCRRGCALRCIATLKGVPFLRFKLQLSPLQRAPTRMRTLLDKEGSQLWLRREGM